MTDRELTDAELVKLRIRASGPTEAVAYFEEQTRNGDPSIRRSGARDLKIAHEQIEADRTRALRKSTIDPNKIDIFFIIRGVQVASEVASITDNLYIYPNYAKVMAPVILAYDVGPDDGPSQGHWDAVEGGRQRKAYCEGSIIYDSDASLDNFQIAYCLKWSLRILFSPSVDIPYFSDQPFVDKERGSEEASFWPIDRVPDRFSSTHDLPKITESDLVNIRSLYHLLTHRLCNESFVEALELFDVALDAADIRRSYIFACMFLERLYGINLQGTGKVLAKAVAVEIGGSKSEMNRRYNDMIDIYAKRGRLIHRGENLSSADIYALLSICREVLMHVLMRREDVALNEFLENWRSTMNSS